MKKFRILWYKLRVKWLEQSIKEAEADIRTMKSMKANFTRLWMRLQSKMISEDIYGKVGRRRTKDGEDE